jgi:hypothetical protein
MSQLWMRFRLLGIQVTNTLRAKRKLVRKYARLMGSSMTNLLTVRLVADVMRRRGEPLLCSGRVIPGDIEVEK